MSVQSAVQQEYNIIRFVVHNIDISLFLNELGQEIQSEKSLKIIAMRWFTRKYSKGVHLMDRIFITVFGINLPKEIKMFYMIEEIHFFLWKAMTIA